MICDEGMLKLIGCRNYSLKACQYGILEKQKRSSALIKPIEQKPGGKFLWTKDSGRNTHLTGLFTRDDRAKRLKFAYKRLVKIYEEVTPKIGSTGACGTSKEFAIKKGKGLLCKERCFLS